MLYISVVSVTGTVIGELQESGFVAMLIPNSFIVFVPHNID